MASPITNCTISVPKFGQVRVKAEYVQHGMNLLSIGAAEEQSRSAAQYHTTHVTSGSFELGLVFTSYRAAATFMRWVERYMRWMADPKSPGAPARVIIPSRRFDKTGVLKGGVRYGDKVGEYVYRAELTFVGSRDPIDLRQGSTLTSAFVGAAEKELVWLYPTGSGLAPTASWNALASAPDPDYGNQSNHPSNPPLQGGA